MKRNFLILFFVILNSVAFSQVLKPAKWTAFPSKQEVKAGETIELIMYAEVDKGWYIYAAEKSEAEYAPQTVFTFDSPEKNGYKLVGSARSIGAKTKFDEYQGGNVLYLTGKAEFRQKVKITNKSPKIIFSVEAQVCSTSCVLVTDDFEITNLKVTDEKVNPDPKGQVTPKDSAKETNSAKTNSPVDNNNTAMSGDHLKNVESLEKEKQKLVKKDKQGKDESVEYLKEFVNKYGK